MIAALLAIHLVESTIQVKQVVTTAPAYKVILEFIEALLTFPLVTLIVFAMVFWLYKDEIRERIKDVKSLELPGLKINMDPIAIDAASAQLADVVLEPERKEVNALPVGPDRDRRGEELNEQKNALQERFSSALPEVLPQIITFNQVLNNSASSRERMDSDVVDQAVGQIIKAHIATTNSKVLSADSAKQLVLKDEETLYKNCVDNAPSLLGYGPRMLKKLIKNVAFRYAPEVQVASIKYM